MDNSWELPDPFIKEDGRQITKTEEWTAQREYIKRLLEDKMYGKMPPRPVFLTGESLEKKRVWDGKGIYERVRLHTGPKGEIAFEITVFRPAYDKKTIPVVFAGGMKYFKEEIAEMAVGENYSVIVYEFEEAAPDSPEYGNASCAKAYPEYSWKVIAMWAWLQSRVIDWLEKQDFADISKVVATGHSRFGKTALCCGVYDERVAICAPAGSGCGGMSSLRLTGTRLGQNIGTAERIGVMLNKKNFSYWLLDRMAEYGNPDICQPFRENELPFDSNFMGAAIAPRGLILLEGLDDTWVNPFGTQTAWLATTEVYQFLGVKEKCALHYREGGHAFNKEDWSVLLDFGNVILQGKAKQSNYKTILEKEVKCGYSWRCPQQD